MAKPRCIRDPFQLAKLIGGIFQAPSFPPAPEQLVGSKGGIKSRMRHADSLSAAKRKKIAKRLQICHRIRAEVCLPLTVEPRGNLVFVFTLAGR